MKKIFTLLLGAAFPLFAGAQAFSVTYFDEPVSDGDVINVEAEVIDLGGAVLAEAGTNPSSTTGLMLKSNLDADFTVNGTVTSITNPEGYSILKLCCGGDCISASGTTIGKTFTMSNGETQPFQYDVDFGTIKENYGTVATKLTISAASQTMTIYVNFTYSDPAGIAENFSDKGLTFDENGIVYKFTTAAQRVLRLYSVDGRLVSKQKLSNDGTFRFPRLNSGAYIVELKENGRQTFTQKVYVK